MHKRIISGILFFCAILTNDSFAQVYGLRYEHPSWSLQSNVYEVNLRQYSASGKIRDFQTHLPRLKKMGVEILWFMPVTPIGIEGRKMTAADLGSYYAVRDYTAISEEFGTMADWKAMVKKAQSMGFKVITDWVANHSAQDNRWVKKHPEFYVKDSLGKLVSPFDWTDVYKLNYKNRTLRDSMIASMLFWVKETGIDGFRCDVAEEVPDDFWVECIASLKKVKNVFMLAEGEHPRLHDAGFDATYGWNLMHNLSEFYKGKITLAQFDSAYLAQTNRFPSQAMRMYFTANHDENSWNGTEFEKYGDAHKAFAVLTQTLYQSIPLIYNGQEEPNQKRLKFFVKDPIEWKGYAYAAFYSKLLALRKNNPALAFDARYERLPTTYDKKVMAYTREKAGKKIMVILNLTSEPVQVSINHPSARGKARNLFEDKIETLTESQSYTLPAWGYTVYEYTK